MEASPEIIIAIIVTCVFGAVAFYNFWYRHHPYKAVGDLIPIDPAPGLPQIDYLDRTWEIHSIRLHADQWHFDLRLIRGREEDRTETFIPEQIAPLHNILSVLAPTGGPAKFVFLRNPVIDSKVGRDKYKGNWNSVVRLLMEKDEQIKSLDRRNRELNSSLRELNAELNEMRTSIWKEVPSMQGGGGGKE